nr:flagellar hook-length control protein FliK [Sphingomonas vulcanisoli]
MDPRPAPDRADDRAAPLPQQQTAPAATHQATAAAKSADIGSTEAVITRHLDLARGNQWLDGLAKDIAATGGTNSSLSFTLSPENLGALKVDITQGADGASVHMTTDTDAARTIILDAQPKLAAEARAQGLTLKETSVSTNSDQQRQPQGQSPAHSSAQQQGGGHDRRAFAQAPAQPLSPTQPTVADEESDDELYA